MNKNRFWIQIRENYASIFAFRRVLYSFILGNIISWLTKGVITPIIFGGKNFSGRNEWIQIAIVFFLAISYTILFVCLSPVLPSSFYSRLNAAFIKPIIEGCLDTLRELKSFLAILGKPQKMVVGLWKILELPDLYWIFGSYVVTYFLYFISPVFLNSGQRMWLRLDFFAQTPIGGDLRFYLSFAKVFFTHHGEYPPANAYPPLFTLLLSPFASIDPSSLYKILVPIIFVSYLLITLIIPGLIVRNNKGLLLLAAFFFTGLFSYGFLFEMERGQFNVIAFLFVLTAVYLFHYKPRLRLLAYVLFSIAVQIKISPAIFIFMFIDNWKDWQTNIKRFAALGAFNVILLFVLGYQTAVALLSNIQKVLSDFTGYEWIGNHSIKSFIVLLQAGHFRDAFSGLHLPAVYAWAMENAAEIEIFITILMFLCFLVIVFSSLKRNLKGFNPYLFVVSTLVALLFPAISQDYTLAILGSAVGLALASGLDADTHPKFRVFRHLVVLLIAFAYCSVLYSYEYKPLFLQSNLPALMILLFCFTILAILPKPADGSATHPVNIVSGRSE